MTREIEIFTLLLDEGFSKAAWHGPNLLGSLRELLFPLKFDALTPHLLAEAGAE